MTLNTLTNPMPLSAGAVWRGSQTSGQSSYDVEVRICSVDDKGDICGTLTIRNLTPTLPKLVTFFDGEIIGPHHSFTTNKWDATEQDDNRHWNRFKRDLYLRGAISDNTEIPDNLAFMRLKERCIVDDGNYHRDVSGASFTGFYYIAVELCPPSAAAEPETPKKDGFRARSTSNSSLLPFQRSPSPSAWSQASMSSSPAPQSPLASRLSADVERSVSPSLVRTSSYASVVRGGLVPSTAPISVPAASSYGEEHNRNHKAEENGIAVTIETPQSSVEEESPVASLPAPFSPSLEEFPPPSSLLTSLLSARGSSSGKDSALSAHHRRNSSSASKEGRMDGGRLPASTGSFNPVTGYRGAWAQAVMRGFYFASSTDPYQELELHYVGDGMGTLLEEYDDDYELEDKFGNLRFVDREAHILKGFERRRGYGRPKASASFDVL